MTLVMCCNQLISKAMTTAFVVMLVMSLCNARAEGIASKPNILWITCEDISPYLGCYGCEEAHTPNLDKLAECGVRYTHAYANAPVCAVARSTLITGMYATTTGTHHMRCSVQLPPSIPAYSRLLREAGYYCTNNSKKDYNSNLSADSTLWDESNGKAHWRNRKPGQPFLAVFNLTVTHESRVGRSQAKTRVDPKDVKLPPYHPDLPEIRKDWACLHDLITAMDSQAGSRIQELENDGLDDNTIIFFYSDHGGNLSRAKCFIYNTGTQVPLIVSVPEKWQHLAPAQPGQVSDRLVSFVDFPKTVLSLAGAEIPELMQGRIFMGENKDDAPQTVSFYRDRQDEVHDFSRAITDGKYYYIHNFMPHRPRGRDFCYTYQRQASRRAWQKHFEDGKCNAVQSQFYNPKPVIQLFDTDSDPWQVNNLADEQSHREHATRLAACLDEWMIRTRDTGLIPEPMFNDLVGPGKKFGTLYEYAQSDEYPVAELLRIAKASSMADPDRLQYYLEIAQHQHPAARYYGAYALFLLRSEDRNAVKTLRLMMANDAVASNRIMAAQALAFCGDADSAYAALRKEVDAADSNYLYLFALNAIRHSRTDDRLTLEDWKAFGANIPENESASKRQVMYLVKDAISLWPERRRLY